MLRISWGKFVYQLTEQDAGVQTENVSLNELLPKRHSTLRDVFLPGSSIEVGELDKHLNKSYAHSATQTFVRKRTLGTQTEENDNRFHVLQKSVLLYQSSRVHGEKRNFIRLKANHKLTTELRLERKDVDTGATILTRIHPDRLHRLHDDVTANISQDYLQKLTLENDNISGKYDHAHSIPVKTLILVNSLR